MSQHLLSFAQDQLAEIEAAGLTKRERHIHSAQAAHITLADGRDVINFCANNYLGLANHPEVVSAAREALLDRGFGMASVRFICGTQDIHRRLEKRITTFLGTEDTILYPSCFDANGGLFETLLGPEDAVISDALNHASIIDGIRLCKAARYRFAHNDMADLERQLIAAQDQRHRIIATDGVFSMDGTIANLPAIVALARKYDALLMMDECHATGFLGPRGRGTHDYHDLIGEIDIITGTLGKALGGASGGFTSARKPLVDLLRQRSRPYLFSNTIAPPIAAASLKVFDLLEQGNDLRARLHGHTRIFREGLTDAGFDIPPGDHPIVPVMLGDAVVAQTMAEKLLERGIYVIGFFFPVVPKGQARIRTQISAAHSREDIEAALSAFRDVKADMEG